MLRCEDTEFCIRVRQMLPESQFIYEPIAAVRHRVPASRMGWSYFCARCYTEGLAKALLAQLIGPGDGLSSERSYALHTLPLGVLHNLGQAWVRREGAGVMRAGAIVVGLTLTAAGFVKGRLSVGLQPRVEQPRLIS